MMNEADLAAVNQLRRLDAELETILTSFDTSYAWNYGSVKEGLRDLYEKAKRDQWNGTTQLPWDTDVDPERGIIPDLINPLAGGNYRVKGDNGMEFLAKIGGRMRRYHIRVIPGDRVTIAVSPYDPTHGLIVFRGG